MREAILKELERRIDQLWKQADIPHMDAEDRQRLTGRCNGLIDFHSWILAEAIATSVSENIASTKPAIGKDTCHYGELIQEAREVGCSDGNCLWREKRGGQHTNGGCHCMSIPGARDPYAKMRNAGALIGKLASALEFQHERADGYNAALEAADAQNAKLREALEFYAKPELYFQVDIADDEGKRARAALGDE